MKQKFFKVWVGYDKFLPITEGELSKALAAHLSGGVAVLESGSVTGKNITLIEPDYHRAMGFNEGYKLQPEDWNLISQECADYRGYLAEKKSEVQNLLHAGHKLLS